MIFRLFPVHFRQTIYLLVVLFCTPFLALGQKVADLGLATSVIDLSDKTFAIGKQEDTGKPGNDLKLYLIFHKDGSATFRVKRGNTITEDNPLSWRFVGDSLYIQPNPITIESEGRTQYIAREPMKYAIEKTPGGYLLREKEDQMILIELK